uniref:Uncharacterized protein n=1 Tax=viral metagenome TaxID=1070528 RepID=A0A6C0H585_9ZZZZ
MRKKHKRGGYSSASDYVLKTFGDGDQQFNNTYKNTQGQNLAQINSGSLGTLSNPNSGQVPYIGPKLVNGGKKKRSRSFSIDSYMDKFYKGGKTKRGGRRRRSKKGGIGSLITQATVPFALFGLQQSYKKKHANATRRNNYR